MFRVSQWFISKQICPYKNKEINYFSNFFFFNPAVFTSVVCFLNGFLAVALIIQ